jgi:hypothetical protein
MVNPPARITKKKIETGAAMRFRAEKLKENSNVKYRVKGAAHRAAAISRGSAVSDCRGRRRAASILIWRYLVRVDRTKIIIKEQLKKSAKRAIFFTLSG